VVAIVSVLAVLALLAGACRSSKDKASDGDNGSGAAAAVTPGPGFDGTTIKVGAITPLTGVAAVIGNPLTAGNKAYFDAVNAKGGIAGKYKVEMETVDSKYEAQTAVQQYAATKADVAMYVQILGTAIVDAIRPQLETDHLLAGPASLDAFWVREPNLMPIGGPYQVQVINGMDYAIRNLDAKNKTICALTKDDPYGETGLAGLDYAAEKDGFTVASKATFKTGDTDFTAQINQLQSAGCEITLLVALPSETAPILSAAAGRNFAPKWLGQSPTWVGAFATSALAPYLEANFILMSEGPQWGDTSVEGMNQMLSDIQAYAPDQQPDIYFAFGYAQAWAASQILEQAVTDGDLSPQGILDASTKISELTFGGLLGNYTYGAVEDRNPPRASTMFAVDPSVPGALKALETNFTSDAAQEYEFKT
jgi:ABC-type branched-subunit amino acid transport system substrate-binding protein